MSIAEAILSGMLQGITEFLPISSSGHLVLLHKYFGFSQPQILFDLFLHLGTLAAVLLYFRHIIIKLIRERNIPWLAYIMIGTIPAVVAALFFEDKIISFFVDPKKVAYMFIVTAMVLFGAQAAIRFGKQERKLDGSRSLAVGIAQAFALFPGISRTGLTISTGLGCGVNPKDAFNFAFLLSVPAILGGVVFQALKINDLTLLLENKAAFFAGTVTAFAVGMVSLPILWHILKKQRLYVFGIYCFCLGTLLIIF